MMKYLLTLFFMSVILTGCTDASWDANFGSLGEKADVTCYSGGKIVFEDRSTGQVMPLEGGGWAFRDTQGNIVKTFADCFVIYKK